MSRTGDDTPTVEGAFIRIRALGHAVAYAGVRVQEGTTAAETIELVAKKLRMSEDERLSKRLVCAYPVERRSARQPRPRGAPPPPRRENVVWRVRTLLRAESVLAARRKALLAAEGFDVDDDVRFYLHDADAPPLDFELPHADDASGSDASDDESTKAMAVVDRRWLEDDATTVGSLLKLSSRDPNLWRRRTCVVCRDRLWFWRAELAPDPALVVPDEGEAPEVAWGRALDAEALERSTCAHVDLAGGHVAESIFHRRAAPHALDVATATRTWTFRCADQKERAKWLKALRAATAAATRRARAASGDGDAPEEEPPAESAFSSALRYIGFAK